MLLLESITDLLETIMLAGFHTTLHKIRNHTNIWGNDLADAAAKLAVQNFDSLPTTQTTRVEIEEISPRPTHGVIYTATAPTIRLSSLAATTRRAN